MSWSRRNSDTRRPGKGVVLFIALLFVSSAVLRLGSGAGSAIAQASSQQGGTSDTNDPMRLGEDAISKRVPEQRPANREDLGALLDTLRAREERIDQREAQMQMRKKALEIADREVSKRMIALEQIEKDLRQTLSLSDGAAEGDLTQLTAVYENMKSKDAAALFEAMDPPFAAGFLGRMRADSAAAIMAGLTPDAAYTISVILAGRNANVPKS